MTEPQQTVPTFKLVLGTQPHLLHPHDSLIFTAKFFFVPSIFEFASGLLQISSRIYLYTGLYSICS